MSLRIGTLTDNPVLRKWTIRNRREGKEGAKKEEEGRKKRKEAKEQKKERRKKEEKGKEREKKGQSVDRSSQSSSFSVQLADVWWYLFQEGTESFVVFTCIQLTLLGAHPVRSTWYLMILSNLVLRPDLICQVPTPSQAKF